MGVVYDHSGEKMTRVKRLALIGLDCQKCGRFIRPDTWLYTNEGKGPMPHVLCPACFKEEGK